MAFVQKYVQSETDKVRTDYSQKLKTANDELSKLKPAEKSDIEKALEAQIALIEKKESELAAKEKAMAISEKLKEKNLPSELSKFLNVEDDKLDSAVDEVAKMLGGYFLDNTNKPSNHNTNRGLTKTEFKKMDYGQRAKLYSENPQLYNALIK